MSESATAKTQDTVETMRWIGNWNGSLKMIDQTRLPQELVELDCNDVETVWEAIKQLRVRGAPAIGIAAGYGVVLAAANQFKLEKQLTELDLLKSCEYLATSRPTAVNLFWALDRMRARIKSIAGDLESNTEDAIAALLDEARAIHDEDRAMCRAIGRNGVPLLAGVRGVLTHCNAGGLATAEYGTALSIFFTAQDQGQELHVYADETRPLLQGARLTAWELQQRGIQTTLICDSMAAQVMKEGRVQAVVTGADRIAANGDSANKIGTYGVALLAKAHQIPFYIAAPSSTFDLSIENGDQIPIEERSAEEITHGFGRQTAPDGIDVYNPAFDVTPAELIAGIVTEFGVIRPVTTENVRQHFESHAAE
ncbi:MAG: S-methyl-5-thioribose-1-phosphate isomerase [Pirellulaceae bacterium]